MYFLSIIAARSFYFCYSKTDDFCGPNYTKFTDWSAMTAEIVKNKNQESCFTLQLNLDSNDYEIDVGSYSSNTNFTFLKFRT